MAQQEAVQAKPFSIRKVKCEACCLSIMDLAPSPLPNMQVFHIAWNFYSMGFQRMRHLLSCLGFCSCSHLDYSNRFSGLGAGHVVPSDNPLPELLL